MAVRLGELLLKENVITPQQLQDALDHQKANGGKLGRQLVSLGFARQEQIFELISRQYGLPRFTFLMRRSTPRRPGSFRQRQHGST